MQKIIIDTNVLVSALISKDGIPGKIIYDLIFNERVNLCLSDEIIQEYDRVLDREKFSKFKDFRYNSIIVMDVMINIASYGNPME